MNYTLSPLEKAACGALSAVIGNAAVYPLDLAKTKVQSQTSEDENNYQDSLDVISQISAKEGFSGLYKGMGSSLLGNAVTNFTYFYWYSVCRSLYMRSRDRSDKPSRTSHELLLGIVAAALSQVFVSPIGVITAEKQTRQEPPPAKGKGIWKSDLLLTAKHIVDHNGWTGLWKGFKVSLVLTINPSITYGSYERLKYLVYGNKRFLKPEQAFLLGVFSKALATLVTQPLIVTKAILQKSSNGKHKAKQTFQKVLYRLWTEEGIKGMWKGVLPQIAKGVLVQGLLFMCRDQIEMLFILLIQLFKRKRSRLMAKS